ncbi:MAG: hypothetical protein AAFO87_00470 [Cyanobacteria bacterium J06607_6]
MTEYQRNDNQMPPITIAPRDAQQLTSRLPSDQARSPHTFHWANSNASPPTNVKH